MSLTDLEHLKKRVDEAGRMIDLADRNLCQVLLKMNRKEFEKYGQQINNILNLLNSAEVRLK